MTEVHSPSGDRIRVLIVDDHAVVRQGLRTFLELQDDPALPIEVTGEAADGVEAVELAANTQPDIVLLDLVMPHLDGIQAIPRILACSAHSRILVLTSFGEEDKVLPAIRAGAQGYLLKDIPPDELVHAIRETHVGKVQLHPEITRMLISVIATKPGGKSHPPIVSPAELTDREQQVLCLIAEGLSNRGIAEKMFLSEKTVKTHVSNILGKLHLQDRTQAAVYALKNGFATGKE